MIPTAFGVALIVIGFLMFLGLWARNYRKAGPDEALIVYGGGLKYKAYVMDPQTRKPKIGPDGKPMYIKRGWKAVIGGAIFTIPVLQRFERISLKLMSIDVKIANAYSLEGVPVNIDAVANVKINSETEAVARAVERFLGIDAQDIKNIIKETLEGQLRDIVGTLTVEQLYRERDDFVSSILKQVGQELDKIGVLIDIINIQTISDEKNYLENLGRKRTAEIKRDAEIGEAEADRDSVKKASIALREGQVVKAEQERQIAEAEKDRDVAKADYFGQTLKAQKTAEQEGPKAEAIARQSVIAEEVKIREAEQRALQKVQAERIIAEEKRWTADKVVPADAEKQKVIKLAEGEAGAIMKKAEAEAQAKLKVGTAEAEVIKLKLEKEAEGLKMKADAWEKYGHAANFMNTLDALKAMMEQAAYAASGMKIDKVVVIDSGGDGKGNPIARTMNAMPAAMVNLFEQLKAATNIDLESFIKALTDKTTSPGALTSDSKTPKPPQKKK
jgi:flotillin